MPQLTGWQGTVEFLAVDLHTNPSQVRLKETWFGFAPNPTNKSGPTTPAKEPPTQRGTWSSRPESPPGFRIWRNETKFPAFVGVADRHARFRLLEIRAGARPPPPMVPGRGSSQAFGSRLGRRAGGLWAKAGADRLCG